MNLSDGYGRIEHGGKVYDLIPSFANMAKIGSPSEIVEKMHSICNFNENPVRAFSDACEVLNACGIPDHLTGGIVFSEWQNKTIIDMGLIHPHDVIVLASHCMQHGMCGNSSQLSKVKPSSGNKVTEFDPAEYIVVAKEYLNLTLDEAEGLTMAKFIRLSEAKTDLEKRRYMKSNNIPTQAESKARFEENERMAAEYEAARKARKLKEQQ